MGDGRCSARRDGMMAPGVDLFAPLPAGEMAGLIMRHGVMTTDYCFPASLADAVSPAYERPLFLPGTNALLATVPLPADPASCSRAPTARPLERCWAHAGCHIDFAGQAAFADAVVALAQEVKMRGRCCHPHVIRLHAACLQPPRCCLVMELCETNLEHLMAMAPGRPTAAHAHGGWVLTVALDVARAFEYLHPTIVHRDLKPQPANVLINGVDSQRPVTKLSIGSPHCSGSAPGVAAGVSVVPGIDFDGALPDVMGGAAGVDGNGSGKSTLDLAEMPFVRVPDPMGPAPSGAALQADESIAAVLPLLPEGDLAAVPAATPPPLVTMG
ncbi:hypothetical protein GPECTOR_13g615 [Gonium pectorale]|uniref:Protein kinase domain-containing protein n=1 Tax=Gonium pectorale TaxID=33097 RepID=A0A150GMX4_GONPE|nr:hypothetical protein GPECTOR_13g615 [Gonium pectorale]|eukprot:KXZ51128.1 hypothetical protein GPECTOR_13g615 [Gonium pectorale]